MKTTSDLKMVIECQKGSKQQSDLCIANHKEKFAQLFDKHGKVVKGSVADHLMAKQAFDKELEELLTSIDKKIAAKEQLFNTLENSVRMQIFSITLRLESNFLV